MDLYPGISDSLCRGRTLCKAGNKEIPSARSLIDAARPAREPVESRGPARPGGCENKTVKNNSRIAGARRDRRDARSLAGANEQPRGCRRFVLNAKLYGQTPLTARAHRFKRSFFQRRNVHSSSPLNMKS